MIEFETFDDVFDALCDTPAEAATMKVRADVLAALIAEIKSWQLSQEAAAARLGVTRPRLNDLMGGKLDKFSLDDLINLAGAVGMKFEVKTFKAA